MQAFDWLVVGVMVLLLALVFLGLAWSIAKPSRSVGGRMSKRVASGLVVRRILRATDHRRGSEWN